MKLILDIDDTIFRTMDKWVDQFTRLYTIKRLTYNSIMKNFNSVDEFFYSTIMWNDWVKFLTKRVHIDTEYYDLKLLKSLSKAVIKKLNTHDIYFISARPECCRNVTINELQRYGFKTDNLVLRPNDLHYSKITEWKLFEIDKLNNVFAMFDDNYKLRHALCERNIIFGHIHPNKTVFDNTYYCSNWTTMINNVLQK